MNYRANNSKTGAPIIVIVCALVFIIFSFLWLYYFQADVLAVSQHVLSGGKTHYNRTIGALLITLVLFMLQRVVHAATHLPRSIHALTYFPSLFALTILSDVPADIDRHASFGHLYWVVPLGLLLWGACVWMANQLLAFSKDVKEDTGLFSNRMWQNLLQLAAMIIAVPLLSNSNAVFHFTVHAEAALIEGDVDEALRVGKKSHETDENLMMLRAFALSEKRLCCYRHQHRLVAFGRQQEQAPTHAGLFAMGAFRPTAGTFHVYKSLFGFVRDRHDGHFSLS